ncbi:MAG: hypothetical protein ACLR0U_33045 [Enterocloster clostridioformis]
MPEIEDQAESFARKTVELYQDKERLNQLCHRTQDYIKKHYSLDGALEGGRGDFRDLQGRAGNAQPACPDNVTALPPQSAWQN